MKELDMTDHDTPKTARGVPPYTAASRRKSRNLVLFLFGLAVFIAIVFGALYLFGQRFGVPV